MKALAPAATLLAGGFALTFAVDPWQHELVSDIPLYRGYAELFLDGAVPYRDIGFEYPPLAALLMGLPGLVSLELDTYRLVFAGVAFALALGVGIATAVLAGSDAAVRRRALIALALAPLATGALIRTHFDLAPVLCLVAGLAAIGRDRPRTGFALLAVGGALKVFPLVAVPVAAAWLAGRGRARDAAYGVAVAAAITALAIATSVAVSPGGAWDAVQYHLERPVQIESLPATALNALDAVGGRAPEPIQSHRSDGLDHPIADAFGALSAAFLCAALAALTLVAWRSTDTRALALAGLGAAAAFAAFGKVLSPQFMLWLAPLAALAFAWRMHALAATGFATIAATLLWFPQRYFDLVDRDTAPILAVALRNLLLVATLALLARELARLLRASPATARSTPPARPPALRSAPR